MIDIIKAVFSEFKNICIQFWTAHRFIPEYFLKLDGYYYCKKQKKTIVVMRVRNKRTVEKISVKKIITDKNLIKELHPADACIIGMLANNERNGIVDTTCDGWKNMRRFRQFSCFVKANPILHVSKKYFDKNNQEIIVLQSRFLKKEIEISTIDLVGNEALLYALDSLQAVSIGYDASEFQLRQALQVSNV